MASDASIGDIEIPYLDVTPGDGTTAGTLTVHRPEGAPLTPTVTPGTPADGTVRLTATPVTFNQPGRWVLHWDVAGTGASAEDLIVFVVPNPTAGGPTWLPGRSRVANYIPSRTLSVNSPDHQLTFDSLTRPTGVMVDRLIADAAARIAGRVGPVDSSLHDTASVVAALLAAAAVERGWPDDENTQASLQRANDLERQAETALTELARANEAATGTNPTDPGQANAQLPRWSFPSPVPWGDDLFL